MTTSSPTPPDSAAQAALSAPANAPTDAPDASPDASSDASAAPTTPTTHVSTLADTPSVASAAPAAPADDVPPAADAPAADAPARSAPITPSATPVVADTPTLSPALAAAFAQAPTQLVSPSTPAATPLATPVANDAPTAPAAHVAAPATPPAGVRVLPTPAIARGVARPAATVGAAPSARPGGRPGSAPRQWDDEATSGQNTTLRIADIVQPVEIETVLPDERAALDQIDIDRRLRLLRIIAPGLLVVILLALPFAIQSDLMSHSFASVPQVLIGLAGAIPATWGTFRRKVTAATLGFFLGVTGVIVLLVLQDGPMSGTGQFTLMSVIDFALLAIPIAVAGVLGSPRLVLVATGGAVVFTLGVLLLTPHDTTLMAALQSPGGLAIFTIPLATLIMLLFAATSGYRRTQRELGAFRIAYARERELDRLKNQFISNVNHELRTPIMALQGYIELARALGPSSAASQEQMLARGGETTDYLAGLVRAILNVRRIEDDAANIHPEVFALRPVILSATNLLDPRASGERQRDLYLRTPDGLNAYADPERVRQVMVNLLSNANKYSPEGSPIEITARLAPAQSQRGARIRDGQPGPGRTGQPEPMVEVAVRDYGLGIPPEQAVLLFQRFVRLERDIASNVLGSGLGLAICRAYVEAMGGRIWVESDGQSGNGSTFTFTLPVG